MEGEIPSREVTASRRPWPHEWVFIVFLTLACGGLLVTAGMIHPASLMFLALLGGAVGLVGWGRQRPTPLRWRIRLLGFTAICGGVYLALRLAIPAMHDPAALETAQTTLRKAEDIITLGAFDFVQSCGHPLLVDLFTVCYFFFFYYLVLGPIHFYLTDLRRFRACMVGLLTAYGLGFFGYVLVPANGPFVWMGERVGGSIWDLGNKFVTTNSNGFDAFPSLHFAATFFLLSFDWRHYRRRFWILLAPTLGLWMATVYLRYHYVADLVGGLVVALIAIWITNRFERSHRGEPLTGEDGPIPSASAHGENFTDE